MADDRAVFGITDIFLVTEKGVGVSDTVNEVQERSQRGVADELLGSQPGADHGFGPGDSIVGNSVYFRQNLNHLLLSFLGHFYSLPLVISILFKECVDWAM